MLNTRSMLNTISMAHLTQKRERTCTSPAWCMVVLLPMVVWVVF